MNSWPLLPFFHPPPCSTPLQLPLLFLIALYFDVACVCLPAVYVDLCVCVYVWLHLCALCVVMAACSLSLLAA